MYMVKDFGKTAIIAGDRHRISFGELLLRITQYKNAAPVQAGDRCVILSENREGWVYALYSIWQNHAVAVPVDATSTAHDVAYILRDSTPACIWTSRQKLPLAQEALAQAELDIPIHLIGEYERAAIPEGTVPAEVDQAPDDLCLIIYTSGTTGSPKGVMLTFGNIISVAHSVSVEVPIYRHDLRTLMLLPLHHILPLMGTIVAPLMTGGGICICPSLSATDLMQTLQGGEVGIIIGVPRLWQTVYNGVMKVINANPLTRGVFCVCRWLQWRWLSRLVFRSVQTKLGGHLAYIVSGGAALDREVGVGLKTLGIDVLEGYGMSEAAPVLAFTRPDDIKPGSVGKPMPSVQAKFVDGELYCKGPNIMRGYYNRPEETAAILDSEGWLHTGDLGYFDNHGRIVITGRSKEIIVLSNGKNINPAEIEHKLEQYTAYVKEAGVIQDMDMLRAIIVPQPEWAQSKSDAEIEETLKHEVLEDYNRQSASYKHLMNVFVFHGDLPRTKLDKLQRFKLPALLLSGEHKDERAEEVIVEPAFPEYKVIKQYIWSEKHCPVHPTDHIETDLAFDSLDMVGLQEFIEQTFGMQLPSDRITRFANITEMATYVADYKTRIEVEKTDWHHILSEDTSALPLPQCRRSGVFYTKLFKGACSLYFRLSATGLEHIPANGPYILAANHQSFLDGLFVMSYLSSPTILRTYFYAKQDHVRLPIVKWMAARHNVVVMEPGNLKKSIQTLGEALKRGSNIIIFPEGTRTDDGTVSTFKKTFAILASELHVPIIPVCIKGAYHAMPRHTKVPRPYRVQVHYLEPVQPDGLTYDQLSDRVRDSISRCL